VVFCPDAAEELEVDSMEVDTLESSATSVACDDSTVAPLPSKL